MVLAELENGGVELKPSTISLYLWSFNTNPIPLHIKAYDGFFSLVAVLDFHVSIDLLNQQFYLLHAEPGSTVFFSSSRYALTVVPVLNCYRILLFSHGQADSGVWHSFEGVLD